MKIPPALKCDAQTPSLPPRCRIERRVVWNLISHLRRAGFRPVAVEADDDVKTPTATAMMEELFSMDEGRLYFRKPGGSHRWVMVILGNDGWDAVSDWGVPTMDDGFDAAMRAFDGEQYA